MDFFQPSFGNRPQNLVGRDDVISLFLDGLKESSGSANRCTLFLGQRGMGKTALLLELESQAEKMGFTVARVTAHQGMAANIVEQLQLKGSEYFDDDKKHISGFSAGALGFSLGLSFTEEAQRQYGFRAKMSLLCDRLKEKNKGVLILIDEVHTSPEMREVAASYQELVGDGKDIAIGMAGLPFAVSGVLNDRVLTFLNRARRIIIDTIPVFDIFCYYKKAFTQLGITFSESTVEKAAEMSCGIPYLMQLIGYYLLKSAGESRAIDDSLLQVVKKAAFKDMENNVFRPILAPLSDNDRIFIKAMAEIGDTVSISDLEKKLSDKGPALQPYRKRLLDAAVIEAPRRGELTFAVPHLADYLRKNEF